MLKESADYTEVNAFDISAQGLSFVSDTNLTPSVEMKFTLRIPSLNREFVAHGTVVWTRKFYTRFRSGIQLDPSYVMGISSVLRMLDSLPV